MTDVVAYNMAKVKLDLGVNVFNNLQAGHEWIKHTLEGKRQQYSQFRHMLVFFEMKCNNSIYIRPRHVTLKVLDVNQHT